MKSSSLNYFQAYLPIRYGNDSQFADVNIQINEKILSLVNDKKVEKIDLTKTDLFKDRSILTDSHILTLSYHYTALKSIRHQSVVSYASDGYSSLLLSDMRFPKSFLRGLLRSRRTYKKFHPYEIWHWDDYAKRRRHEAINLGWRNKFVDTQMVSEYSIKFLNSFLYDFKEISDFNLFEETLFIYPPINLSFDELLQNLLKLYKDNSLFREQLERSEQILIKQHKICTSVFPSNFTFKFKEIRVANSLPLRVLPIDILLLGFRNSTYVSPPSSSLFATNGLFKKILWGSKFRDEVSGYSGIDGYELMMSRHKLNL